MDCLRKGDIWQKRRRAGDEKRRLGTMRTELTFTHELLSATAKGLSSSWITYPARFVSSSDQWPKMVLSLIISARF